MVLRGFSVRRNTIVLFAVLVILAIFAWAGWANFESRKQAAERLAASSSQGVLVAAPDAAGPQYVSPLSGKPAPPFALQDVEGKRVSLESYRGKAVLVNFWATWCGRAGSRRRGWWSCATSMQGRDSRFWAWTPRPKT
jgi:cytochrome c biogenesis protein CcmG/thiol:disulfide interchange protein DsbE